MWHEYVAECGGHCRSDPVQVRSTIYCPGLQRAYCLHKLTQRVSTHNCNGHGWAEAPIKIARMTLTIKLDGNWTSFQLANSTPPLSVTDSAIAPSARMHLQATRPKPRSTTQRSRTASYARVLFNAERQRRKEQHPSWNGNVSFAVAALGLPPPLTLSTISELTSGRDRGSIIYVSGGARWERAWGLFTWK